MKNEWHILFREADDIFLKKICLIVFSLLTLLPIAMKDIIMLVEMILGGLIGSFLILTLIRKIDGKNEVIITIKDGEIYYARETNFYKHHSIIDISSINKLIIYSRTPEFKMFFKKDGRDFKWELDGRYLSEEYKNEIREIIALLKEELSRRGVEIVEK